MSTAAQLAREEADKVEAEDAELAEEEEPTPEPEPEPEPQPEPEPPVAAVDPKKIEKAVTTYFGALEKALGPDMGGLSTCPHCVDYIPGLYPVEAPPPLVQDPTTEKCPVCDGVTQFLTGARQGEWVTRSCSRCSGKGYVEKALDQPAQATVYTMPPPAASEPWPDYDIAFVPAPNGTPDPWKRPAGHPRWGLDPSTPRVS